jgi:hypothetical protein
LEIHSSALDDPLLPHIRLPIESEPVAAGQHVLPALGGPVLPALLAAHLAKHSSTPLLWVVDFHTLWTALDDRARARAVRAAREAGLRRHLSWTWRLADSLRALAADGGDPDPAAIRRLERQSRSIGDTHRVVRLALLSASPVDALRVVGGRVWPPVWRRGWRRAPDYLARRATRWAYRRLVHERPFAADPMADGAAIRLGASAAVRDVVSALARGDSPWIVPGDPSMDPAVPSFARARVVAVGAGGPRPGDVVVVQAAHGGGLLRRVVAVGDDAVRLQGDAELGSELVVPRSAVVGVCDQVEIGGRTSPIEDRPHHARSILRAIVRARWRGPSAPRGV